MRRRKLVSAFLIVVFALSSVLLYSRLVRRRAESMVQYSRELSTRTVPFSFAIVQQQYGSRLKPTEGCDPSVCIYEVEVSNRIFSLFRWVPPTSLKSTFWVRDGVVIENMLDYTTRVDNSRTVTVHASVGFVEGSVFTLHPWNTSTPPDTNGLASISSGSIEDKKQVVLALNTSCLTRFGGCTSIAELLPTVWERTANGSIRCRIPNREGFVDRPSSWTWMK
jgi:hypothetical protein